MARANVGHCSGKERNTFFFFFCRITVKTTVVCFLKRLNVNVEHMSGTVLSNVKGHGASSSRIN